VFRKVHVTLAPATRLIVAVRVVRSATPPALQLRLLSVNPAAAASVIVNAPGARSPNVTWFGSVASA
jgi:hypothetical protein